MSKTSTWQGQTSAFLYLYHYVAIIFIAFVVSKYIGNASFAVATGLCMYLFFEARSMKYSLSSDEMYFSPSLGDKEQLTVNLREVIEIQVVDRMPWGILKLGTVILIVNEEDEMHPCIKCISYPHELAKKIKRASQALGAGHINIEIIK